MLTSCPSLLPMDARFGCVGTLSNGRLNTRMHRLHQRRIGLHVDLALSSGSQTDDRRARRCSGACGLGAGSGTRAAQPQKSASAVATEASGSCCGTPCGCCRKPDRAPPQADSCTNYRSSAKR